jgi:competence protein ComEC
LAAPGAPQWLLVVSGAALDRLFDVVEWVLAVGPGPIEAASSPIPVMAAAVLAGSVLLLSSAIPGRRIAPALLLPVLFWQGPTPGEGEFDMTVLDVGQGLSVVVRTRRHALVYDTGAAWPGGDAGAATVRPFLRWTGVNGIDRLMISHGDLDHAGGGASLAPLTSAPVLVGPGTEWLYGPVTVCRDGDAWTWDGVEFRVLHPAVDSGFTGNNASCVLQVSSVAGSALITGDIESVAEKRLARRHPRIRADVVVAPHHGSATSSSIDLVGITRPRWVVFSAGYRNRWGFPRDEVTARWGSAGAITLQTASTGALTFRFERGGIRREPTRWRCISRHIWRAVDCAGG